MIDKNEYCANTLLKINIFSRCFKVVNLKNTYN